MFIHVAGTGSYLPKRVMTNEELAKKIDTSDEWIVSHTGIRARHLAADDESASTLGIKAAQIALADANVKPEELGLIVLATSSPDYIAFPATACIVQDAIGAKNALAFDISAGCTGFVTALDIARGMMQNDPRPALVVCGETISRIVDWSDRNTAPLFGDGGGAVVLKASADQPGGLLKSYFRTDGSGAMSLCRKGGSVLQPDGTPYPLSPLEMQGRAVFNFAVKAMEETIVKTLELNGSKLGDIDIVIPHQANIRIIEATARRMEVEQSRFFVNIEETANTSSATVPIALDQCARQGKLKAGDRLLLVAFGAGLLVGGIELVWTK